LPGVLVLAAVGVASLAGHSQAAPPVPPVKQYQSPKRAQAEEAGEKLFQQNCARCHASPEGFPQRISGTVVRHMRVRANLSAHDEQELLRYLNP
jgi:mono/diheme cytochrome c family protein